MELFAQPLGLFTQMGTPFFLKGVNWFGFDTETYSPHGLWSKSLDYLLDFLKREKFNAIRLPFSTEMVERMDKVNPTAIDFSQNPDLKDKTAGQVMDIFIQKCKRRGILVLPVMHRFSSDSMYIPTLWYNEKFSEQRVLEAWKHIVSRYKSEPTVFGIDIKNEPHGEATWGSGNMQTDWARAAQRMANALHKINPKLLMFVEGIDRTSDPQRPVSWWGGNLDRVKQYPIQLKIPNKLVYSPHVYGPDVFDMQIFTKDAGFPKNLPKIWTSEWGYIRKERLSTLIIGEWGGRNNPGTKDRIWQTALVEYLKKNGLLCSSFYWSLNPNSGDTQGLLQDDWSTPVSYRLDMVRKACPNPTLIREYNEERVPLPEPYTIPYSMWNDIISRWQVTGHYG